ncbi:hypothetical protein VTN00DRAFT_2423 [Thermoascus crustaceus]|uniref:uncharacterized protein n=1 Tax=Thermoascus crustaceus TaxID=5088 RepID=UPI003742A94F
MFSSDKLSRTAPMEPSQMITGWQIQALQAEKEALEKAAQAWKDLADNRPPLTDNCLERDIAEEAIWIQDSLTAILNQHAKPIRISPYSKRWWGSEVRQARRAYAQAQ